MAAPLAPREHERLKDLIREIPDFPTSGIGFKDITPLMADRAALAEAVHALAEFARPLDVDCVVAAEARGFLLGPALALELGAGFVLARKPGKLPYETVSAEYLLEYGPSQLELHTDAVRSGARVLIHDDLLATGGTALALCELVEQLGGEVAGCGFLIELAFLRARAPRAARHARAASLQVLACGMPTARRSRTVAAPPEQLWDVVSDPHHLPRWWPRVTRVEDVEAGAFTEVMRTERGKLVRADFQLVEVDPRAHRLRCIAGRRLRQNVPAHGNVFRGDGRHIHAYHTGCNSHHVDTRVGHQDRLAGHAALLAGRIEPRMG